MGGVTGIKQGNLGIEGFPEFLKGLAFPQVHGGGLCGLAMGALSTMVCLEKGVLCGIGPMTENMQARKRHLVLGFVLRQCFEVRMPVNGAASIEERPGRSHCSRKRNANQIIHVELKVLLGAVQEVRVEERVAPNSGVVT